MRLGLLASVQQKEDLELNKNIATEDTQKAATSTRKLAFIAGVGDELSKIRLRKPNSSKPQPDVPAERPRTVALEELPDAARSDDEDLSDSDADASDSDASDSETKNRQKNRKTTNTKKTKKTTGASRHSSVAPDEKDLPTILRTSARAMSADPYVAPSTGDRPGISGAIRGLISLEKVLGKELIGFHKLSGGKRFLFGPSSNYKHGAKKLVIMIAQSRLSESLTQSLMGDFALGLDQSTG
ncbi:hypothetical protein PV08_07919 [Exophiala spinifera]|uniref:Uncharacterized protein n=1 Tax=Exophiala spinifera TaxID=91928 RepID=A0A0D2B1C9_9EURO|nr:uncharacterized protein PV08_07919 [Exophiala spinifera]KIW12733.1 hypothetical protein PV08_07919 [Exophiala spinifera]